MVSFVRTFLLSSSAFLVLSIFAACSSSTPVKKDVERVNLGGYVGAKTATEEDEVIQKRALVNKQHQEIERQAREIEDLKRQQFHNEKMRDYSKKTFSKGEDSWTEGESDQWTAEETTNSDRRTIDPSDERY